MTAQTELDFAQSPPLIAPLRFLLTAPLFACAAAIVALGAGPEALAHRWTAPALGVTHLLVLGFVTMTMAGALLQLLPVVAAAPLPRVGPMAAVTYTLLLLGTLLLSLGLLTSEAWLLRAASVVLAVAFAVLLGYVALSLARAASRHATVWAMRLSVASLAVASLLGVAMAGSHGWGRGALRVWADLHLAWAALGWIGLMVVGVSYQVIPMFQMTPPYPAALTRYLAPALFVALGLKTVAMFADTGGAGAWTTVELGADVLLALGMAAFAGTTFLRLQQRRRRLPDTTLAYWSIGMGSLLGCIALWSAGTTWPPLAADPRFALGLGLLYLVGFAGSVLSGMLYKIVPFLVWLHLHDQRSREGGGQPVAHLPSMREIIPERDARRQLRLHVLGVALLGFGVVRPGWLSYAAAVVLVGAWGLLWVNLVRAAQTYRRLARGAGRH